MSKHIKNYSLASIIGLVILYLLFSFVNYDFNPKTWGVDIRLLFAMLSLAVFFMAAVIISHENI